MGLPGFLLVGIVAFCVAPAAVLAQDGPADTPGAFASDQPEEESEPKVEPPTPAQPIASWSPFLRPPGFTGAGPWFAPDSMLVHWVGHGRARQLREARFQFLLSSAHPSRAGDDSWRDPEHLEDYEDIVLSAWGKLVRDAIEDALGIEEWWDRKFDRASRRSRGGPEDTSWHLRLSPRLSEDRLGVKLRLPYTGYGLLGHLSLRVRYDWNEDQTTWILKLDDGARFIHLDFEPDTEEAGDRLSLSVRLAW